MRRFMIRDLFWLTLVVALIAIWRVDLARQQSKFDDVLRNQVIDDIGEAKLLVSKAVRDPPLFAELKAINSTEKQYVKQRKLLYEQYREFFAKARRLP